MQRMYKIPNAVQGSNESEAPRIISPGEIALGAEKIAVAFFVSDNTSLTNQINKNENIPREQKNPDTANHFIA